MDSEQSDEASDSDIESDGDGESSDIDGDIESSDGDEGTDGDMDVTELDCTDFDDETEEDISDMDSLDVSEDSEEDESSDSGDDDEATEDETDLEEEETVCEEDPECYDGACGEFGTCAIVDEVISCICNSGYTGDRCNDCDRESGYRWNDVKTECLYRPCPEFPCDEGNNQYCSNNVECRCPVGSHWSDDGVTCTENLCDPNPCLAVAHSTGACTHTKSTGSARCECNVNYLWDDDNRLCYLDCHNQCDEIDDTDCISGDLYTCQAKNEDCNEWFFNNECPSGVCQDSYSCVVCDNECPRVSHVCNGDTLETCKKDNYGCYKYNEESCNLGCEEGECLEELCGSGELEKNEYCDSDTISCSSICADYSAGETVCNDTCSAYDTSTCTQPVVESAYVPISAGSYIKGSGLTDFEPKYSVTLTNDFEIQNLKVTQLEFVNLMGYNPSVFEECGSDCPVENVTYFDAIHYANKLSSQAGLAPCVLFDSVVCVDGASVDDEAECLVKGGIQNAVISLNNTDSIYHCQGYRLPTEAEWEYAAKGGTEDELFYNGEPPTWDAMNSYSLTDVFDMIAWYAPNSAVEYDGNPSCAYYLEQTDVTCGTHPVGLKQPNGYCLYDITGNTREFVYDLLDFPFAAPVTDPVFDPSNIEFTIDGYDAVVTRGCAWNTTAWYCRTSSRYAIYPMSGQSDLGFRLVRTLESGA